MIGRGIACVASFGSLVVAASAATLKDHVSDSSLWNDQAIFDHFIDPDPAWSAIVGSTIVGTGQELKRVGFVWAKSSVTGTPDGGALTELRFRFRFFPSTADFSLAAMYQPAPQSNWAALFAEPSNPNWTTPVGLSFFGIWTLYYAEFDVSSLHIATAPNATHVVAVVPESSLPLPETITVVSMSTGIGAVGQTPDWYESGANLNGLGPAPLDTLNLGADFLATRITAGAASDFDQDDDVDAGDLAALLDCLSGPDIAHGNPVACGTCDLDRDNDVDLADVAAAQLAVNAPT